ncbi:S9 family peptidase [Variovorax sp. YR216]|uniref:alpha/beta hydrolase family protein n=1 Tax=Variovorax sp. YR216 TaxID=1882828 RepID=UPI0008970DCE|nr:alpha/beta fold hydrolase [Variovorax sp. YR216]SEB14290.1 Alpha/beta hydrolase family protein [Variovorax sp. YR216]
MPLFHHHLHDEFGTWPLAYIPAGGAEYGEIEAVARAVGEGDDGAFHAAWSQAAERLAAQGEEALKRGHTAGARSLFLRASCYQAAAYHPLYGEPVDPRLLQSFRRQSELLGRALALGDTPATPLRIPFEGTTLPGYLLSAEGRTAAERGPLLILTNGYDGTMTDMYFASAVAATRRGYHCLMFDGPGQGGALYEQGLRLRPDWETVVRAVVDHALTFDLVDPARIALSGWSLGGYLAPRAASGDTRLSACIADPGLWNVASGFRAAAVQMGVPREAAAHLGELPQPWLDKMEALIAGSPRLHWSVMQRNFWVHGVRTLREYLAEAERYTLDGCLEAIRCPTLVTHAEGDTLAASATALFEALKCPKHMLYFSAAEGAGGHCEMKNRSLLNQRVLDWLDAQFGRT